MAERRSEGSQDAQREESREESREEPRERSIYDHAGGEEALHRLEEIFYAKALVDPVLRTVFPRRQPHHVDHLTWFTAESFGGPDRFTRELGFRHLIDVHRNLKITDEQRERFAALYLEALREAGLPDDEPFLGAVRSHIEFGTRVAQQNSHAASDDELHPLREVPHWQWPKAPDQSL
ncbi:group II truncated hemoglobin [Streptomyces kanamyceticus]|uniref:Globin n=1 Tax=Streptomyces kanamyceticus TaxID=1967 RepID=A0A5J6GAX1_STRKN|nr:group II truncated hemoglobin [Streptomyces kanamyceticus]QEU92920.1 globin [Streptomyces kanamyceticus]